MKLLITGVTGFVGRAVSHLAQQYQWEVVGQARHTRPEQKIHIVEKKISADTQWLDALDGVDCIVHCAAYVHQMKKNVPALYDEVNTQGTLQLARQAIEAGVKRFVFISSIKVNGEWTAHDVPFTPTVEYPPSDPYGFSKYQAEVGLKEIALNTGLEVVIIRPPLVYGPGVKANFLSLMNIVNKSFPLPFGALNAKRSMVHVENLASLILTCCSHDKAIGETFLVSDDHDVSLTELLRYLAQAMNKRSMLLPVPQKLLEIILNLMGKQDLGQRLCQSLQLDITHTQHTLDWSPPISVEEGIHQTVQDFLLARQKH